MIYQDFFACVPNDLIHSRYEFKFTLGLHFASIALASETYSRFRAQFRQSSAHLRDKIGHTTIDLGVAQGKLEAYQDGDLNGTDPMDRLQLVRGHLVSFPLDFMCQEDLRPYFSESEYYTSPQVFH